jgi:hypothetical protein
LRFVFFLAGEFLFGVLGLDFFDTRFNHVGVARGFFGTR